MTIGNLKFGVVLGMRENVSPAMARADRSVSKFRGRLHSLRGVMGGLRSLGPMLGLGLGVAGVSGALQGIGAMTEKYKDLAGVLNAIEARTGANTQQMAALRQEATGLAGTTIFKEIEVGRAQELLGQRGMKPSQILGVLPSVVKLAAAEGAEMPLAAQTMFESMKQFGFEFGDTITRSDGKVVDAVEFLTNAYFQIGNETAAGLAGIQETMVKFAQVAGPVGIKPTEALAMSGVLANVGLAPEESGVAMRNILLRLANPEPKSLVAMKQLGIKYGELLNPDGTLNLVQALERFSIASDRIRRTVAARLGIEEGTPEFVEAMQRAVEFRPIAEIFQQRATAPFLSLLRGLGDIRRLEAGLAQGDFFRTTHEAAATRMKRGIGRQQRIEAEGSMLDAMLGERLFPLRTDFAEFANFMKKGFIARGFESGLLRPGADGGISESMQALAISIGEMGADLVGALKDLVALIQPILVPLATWNMEYIATNLSGIRQLVEGFQAVQLGARLGRGLASQQLSRMGGVPFVGNTLSAIGGWIAPGPAEDSVTHGIEARLDRVIQELQRIATERHELEVRARDGADIQSVRSAPLNPGLAPSGG